MSYLDIVNELQQAFPKPVSDRMHDSYFVFSFMRALDQLDDMKSIKPLLDKPVELDYEQARRRRIDEQPATVEEVSQELVGYLSGMFIWGHPRSQINVVPSPTIPSVIGGLLPSIYNPNLCSDESSRGVAVAEVEAVAMTADLLGYDAEQAGGVFTFGGTGTALYGVKIGLEKAYPGTMAAGIRGPAALICSTAAHYACQTVAGWLGLGHDHVIHVPTDEENAIRTCLLETHCRDVLKEGGKIAAIIATMGTTDAFGVDDLQAVYDIREQLVEEFDLDYRPHIHADAVIGWAWSVFNDYDFESNPLEFRPRTVRSLAGTKRRISKLHLADSIGIDFHKTGFAPYVSSLFLCKDAADLQLITRDEKTTPYLFQSGHYHPGRYTLETTRGGGGPMSALANLRLFGKQGMRALLGHLVTMAEELRARLESHAAIHVLNDENYGPVTLFRVYPDEVDTFTLPRREQTDPRCREELLKYNDYNRRIFDLIQDEALQGRGVVLSLTDCYRETDYGEPIVALKSYIMSPFATEWYAGVVLESLQRARAIVDGNGSPPGADAP